jgi:DNA-binding GntR family transcriptional regulator
MNSIESAPGSGAGHNLSSQAYRAVSELIRNRRLRGGEIIVEAKLAELLGTSRTPLREALQRLEGEGLIVKNATRSFVVRQVDLSEYLQSLRVRELLETEAAALAAHRIDSAEVQKVRREIEELAAATTYHTEAHWRSDDNLHELLATSSGNRVMAQTIRSLRVTTRLFEIARLSDRLGPDTEEHLEILAAIEVADARRARRAVQTHLRSLSRHALQSVGSD